MSAKPYTMDDFDAPTPDRFLREPVDHRRILATVQERDRLKTHPCRDGGGFGCHMETPMDPPCAACNLADDNDKLLETLGEAVDRLDEFGACPTLADGIHAMRLRLIKRGVQVARLREALEGTLPYLLPPDYPHDEHDYDSVAAFDSAEDERLAAERAYEALKETE